MKERLKRTYWMTPEALENIEYLAKELGGKIKPEAKTSVIIYALSQVAESLGKHTKQIV